MRLAGGISFELEDCAIAVFDDEEKLKTATDKLDATGFDYFVLEGESGQESLQPTQDGLVGNLQKLAAAFGDELRVIDRLERSLAEGARVLIVSAKDAQPEIVELLNNHGGRFLWQFRAWTFNSAGSAGNNSSPVAEEDGS